MCSIILNQSDKNFYETWYGCKRKIIYLHIPGTYNFKEKIMARPIKETPTLHDEDAYRFEIAARNVVPLSAQERAERIEAYERIKKVISFSL